MSRENVDIFLEFWLKAFSHVFSLSLEENKALEKNVRIWKKPFTLALTYGKLLTFLDYLREALLLPILKSEAGSGRALLMHDISSCHCFGSFLFLRLYTRIAVFCNQQEVKALLFSEIKISTQHSLFIRIHFSIVYCFQIHHFTVNGKGLQNGNISSFFLQIPTKNLRKM